jgi:hypothetical protein
MPSTSKARQARRAPKAPVATSDGGRDDGGSRALESSQCKDGNGGGSPRAWQSSQSDDGKDGNGGGSSWAWQSSQYDDGKDGNGGGSSWAWQSSQRDDGKDGNGGGSSRAWQSSQCADGEDVSFLNGCHLSGAALARAKELVLEVVEEGVGKSSGADGSGGWSWADGKSQWKEDSGGRSWADGKSSTSSFNHFGSHSCGTSEHLEGKIVEVIDGLRESGAILAQPEMEML